MLKTHGNKKAKAENNRFLYFYAASMVLLITLGALGCVFVKNQQRQAAAEAAMVETRPKFATEMAYVDLPRMTISFSGSVYQQAEVDVSLAVMRRDVSTVQVYVPQIMDRLNGFFPRVRFDEIDKPHVMLLLHKDMLWQVNNIRMPVLVHDLVFRRLIVM